MPRLLFCPPITHSDLLDPTPLDMTKASLNLNSRFGDQIACVGLELRGLMRVDRGELAVDPIDVNGVAALGRGRKAYVRPAVEIAALAFWNQLKTLQISKDQLLACASATAGHAIHYPISRMTTSTPAGVEVAYPEPEIAQGWLERAARLVGPPVDPLKWAMYLYAEVSLSHPFDNANGGMARLVSTSSLGRTVGLGGPFLPLGPLMSRYRERIEAAALRLVEARDWAGYFRSLCPLYAKAYDLGMLG